VQDDPLILFRALPAGAWPTAVVLTVLAVMGNPLSKLGEALGEAIVVGLALLAAGVVKAAVEVGSTCAVVCLYFIVGLVLAFVLLLVLAWRRDD
jgi:hypothetical protein